MEKEGGPRKATLLVEHGGARRVLFLAAAAADGWLALELTGGAGEGRVREAGPGPGAAPPGEVALERGGDLRRDRVFALGFDRRAGAFTFGGAPGAGAPDRPRLFRGLTRLGHGRLRRELDRGLWWPLPALPGLVFDTRPRDLWERARALALDPGRLRRGALGRPRRACGPWMRPRSRLDRPPGRGAGPGTPCGRSR